MRELKRREITKKYLPSETLVDAEEGEHEGKRGDKRKAMRLSRIDWVRVKKQIIVLTFPPELTFNPGTTTGIK